MNENASQEDIAALIVSIQRRDEKLMTVEAEMRRLAEDYRRLREEILPVIKMAKDRSQPLPPPSMSGPPESYRDSTTLTSPSQLTLVEGRAIRLLATGRCPTSLTQRIQYHTGVGPAVEQRAAWRYFHRPGPTGDTCTAPGEFPAVGS